MSRLHRLRPSYSFRNSFQRGHSRSQDLRDDFAPGELAGTPYHSVCWVVIMYHTSLFESRAIPLNMLKNNGLMACASGRLPEICLRGRQGTHARPLNEDQCLAVTASGRSHVVSWTVGVKYLTASLIERRISPRNSVTVGRVAWPSNAWCRYQVS